MDDQQTKFNGQDLLFLKIAANRRNGKNVNHYFLKVEKGELDEKIDNWENKFRAEGIELKIEDNILVDKSAVNKLVDGKVPFNDYLNAMKVSRKEGYHFVNDTGINK